MNFAKPLVYAVALASLSLPACSGAAGEDEEAVGSATQAVVTHPGGGPGVCPGLNLNGLNLNGLNLNGLNLNGLNLNGLNLNGLNLNGIDLTQPGVVDVLEYVVSCALEPSQSFDVSVNGADISFTGSIGLAPEWGHENGHCDKDCQQWVSACVISRIDFTGAHELISMRGQNAELAVTPMECSDYTEREATYYGDVFASPMKLYGCLPPKKSQDPRVCGPSINGCVVDILGKCDDLCDQPFADGTYPNCRGPAPTASQNAAQDGDDQGNGHGNCQGNGQGNHQAQGDVYHGSITVFLHKP